MSIEERATSISRATGCVKWLARFCSSGTACPHRRQAVKDFLSAEAANRLWLVALPPYTPELNLIDMLWNYVKRLELANLCTRSLRESNCHLRKASERMRHRTNIFPSRFQHPFCYLWFSEFGGSKPVFLAIYPL